MSIASIAFAQAGSPLATMSQADLCRTISRNMGQASAYSTPPATVSASADCPARLIRSQVDVALSGLAFQQYVDVFLGSARAGVCNQQDPTMRTFADRGWRFAYHFESNAGEVRDLTLDCSD